MVGLYVLVLALWQPYELWKYGPHAGSICVLGLPCMGLWTVLGGFLVLVGTFYAIWGWLVAHQFSRRIEGWLIASWASLAFGVLFGLVAWQAAQFFGALSPTVVGFEILFVASVLFAIVIIWEVIDEIPATLKTAASNEAATE